MSSSHYEAELVQLENQFRFSSDPTAKAKTLYTEGTISERRFRAVIDLGVQLQERMHGSNKTFLNKYRFVVNRILKQYDLPKEDEPQLRQRLMSYWELAPDHAEDLVGFELNKQAARRNSSRDSSFRSVVERAFEGKAPAAYAEMQPEPYGQDISCYSLSREAGVR